MLRHVLVILLLVFKTAVTSVTVMGILWFFLVFLLQNKDTAGHSSCYHCSMYIYHNIWPLWPFSHGARGVHNSASHLGAIHDHNFDLNTWNKLETWKSNSTYNKSLSMRPTAGSDGLNGSNIYIQVASIKLQVTKTDYIMGYPPYGRWGPWCPRPPPWCQPAWGL